MKKKSFYLFLSGLSVIFALISWAFVDISRMTVAARTFMLQNICNDNNIDIAICGKIETGIFDYYGRAHNLYLNFESGPMHYIPMALVPVFLLAGIVLLVIAFTRKK